MATTFNIEAVQENINFGATGIAEIIQNVRTILLTVVGTVPLDREFGLDSRILDSPIPTARAKMTALLFRMIPKYEPRVKVKAVNYRQDVSDVASGRIIPVVTVEVI